MSNNGTLDPVYTVNTAADVPIILGVVLFFAALGFYFVAPSACIPLDRPFVVPSIGFSWILLTVGGFARTFRVRDRKNIYTLVFWMFLTFLLVVVLGGTSPVPCRFENGKTTCGREADGQHWYYKLCPSAS